MTDLLQGTRIEHNKALAFDLYAKIYNGKDTSALNDFFAADYVEHNPELENGRVALEEFLNCVFGLFQK